MGIPKSNTKIGLIFGLITICIVSFLGYRYLESRPSSEYYKPLPIATHNNGAQFAGSETCIACHADTYVSHSNTSHFQSSALADRASVKGVFTTNTNSYMINDSVRYVMVDEKNIFFQEAYSTKKNSLMSRLKIDITIGSGTKGQTYLNWDKDALHQLQVSYFTPTSSWTNSPGLESVYAPRARPANASCLECHTTFAKSTSIYGMGNTYDKEKMIFGIDCERCHGPALAHVVTHTTEPQLTIPKNITVWDTLSRERRLDVCALCHSGIRTPKKPAFTFLTGQDLSEYSSAAKSDNLEDIDVHGNQYGLLAESDCFKKTQTMDCNTCHDSHEDQRGNMGFYNAKCITCHNNGEQCAATEFAVSENANDCVACHMPLQPSKIMSIERPQDRTKIPVEVRSHLIAVYIDSMNLSNRSSFNDKTK